MKIETHCFNDDGQYKDYEIFIDDVCGYDWKFHGYWDYEQKKWSILVPMKSKADSGESFDETKDVPVDVLTVAHTEYDKIKMAGVKHV